MKRKGQALIGTLIGTLVFLLLLIVAVLPVISDSITTNSSSWGSGTSTQSIIELIPLFLGLAGLVTVAYTYFMGR